ncbi:kinase-like domain-containing protein [Mycena sanguinolenta]|nr:kinase-like domain-containing protein [Mycena sanguinolenta]
MDRYAESALVLKNLHSQDIVHRDLKPSNVLIDDDGTALIADFGISRVLDVSGYTTASVGTRLYIAPELRESRVRTTKKTDVYSFAILTLEVFSSVQRGEVEPNPPRREDYGKTIRDELWAELEPCWNSHPLSRPIAIQAITGNVDPFPGLGIRSPARPQGNHLISLSLRLMRRQRALQTAHATKRVFPPAWNGCSSEPASAWSGRSDVEVELGTQNERLHADATLRAYDGYCGAGLVTKARALY